MNTADFRKNLKSAIERIVDDFEPIALETADGKRVVIIPLDEYTSWKETEYLLNSPVNRKAIFDSIAQIEDGKFSSYTVEELKDFKEDGDVKKSSSFKTSGKGNARVGKRKPRRF